MNDLSAASQGTTSTVSPLIVMAVGSAGQPTPRAGQMGETIISFDAPASSGSSVRWACHLDDKDGQRATITQTFTCPNPGQFEPTGRPSLLSFLLPAMWLGDPVRVHGPVDSETVANLMEWQEAMVRWHPTQLSVVPIAADESNSSGRSSPLRTAIGAFSGGVDSCYTAVRNRPEAASPVVSHRRTTMTAGLMVHGFDINLAQEAVFSRAFMRSTAILEALGMAAYSIHTDVRALEARFPVDWETASHGIWLAGALACFEQWDDVTLIPSTYAYDHQMLPWASNPLTDPLFGSATTPLWHDGAAADKFDKVHSIASEPAVRRGLRVCWEGPELDRNCGHCYKCVITQACWWLAGVEAPACFDAPATPKELAGLDLSQPYRRALADKLHRRAISDGRGQIATALGQALAR